MARKQKENHRWTVKRFTEGGSVEVDGRQCYRTRMAVSSAYAPPSMEESRHEYRRHPTCRPAGLQRSVGRRAGKREREGASMAEVEQVENLIIGSGEAGKWMAWELGSGGQQTVVVERKWIGGAVPNINCLPSTNEIHSAKVAHLVRNAAAFGTDVPSARTNMPTVLARKRKMVEEEVAGHLALYRRARTELVLGEAHFVPPKTDEVKLKDGGTRLLSGGG